VTKEEETRKKKSSRHQYLAVRSLTGKESSEKLKQPQEIGKPKRRSERQGRAYGGKRVKKGG